MTNQVWNQFKKSKLGVVSLFILILFSLIGLYAPLLASSKPLLLLYNHHLYSPLLHYLFFTGFYSKPIDLFFNLLMFTLPAFLLGFFFLRGKARQICTFSIALLQLTLFFWLVTGVVKDPAFNPQLEQARLAALTKLEKSHGDPLLAALPPQTSWDIDLKYLSTYNQLNQLLHYRQMKAQKLRLMPYSTTFKEKTGREMPTLWQVRQKNLLLKEQRLKEWIHQSEENYQKAQKELPLFIEAYLPFSHSFIMAKYLLESSSTQSELMQAENKLEAIMEKASNARVPLVQARATVQSYQKGVAELHYLQDHEQWLENESKKMTLLISPLIRDFHWQEDAGGSQSANKYLPWWELSRVNRKDLMASLLFGIRVSLVVGFSAVSLALLIGIPLGLLSGYFAGKTDLFICRFIEMWEAMPTFFMLLLVIAITQSKSIFLIVTVLGLFGWAGITRFIRSEVLRQRKFSYVTACQSLGFTHVRTMFSHILPNAIPPVLTLLPFSIMAAITSEAGLSFLGLGEEGSTSWGVLMDEGRSVFPAESYLLWPPAILLSLLLISIALVGDRLRDAIDPKMR